MALRIDFFRRGERILAVESAQSLEQATSDARAGLIRFNADKAKIVDTSRIAILAVVTPDA